LRPSWVYSLKQPSSCLKGGTRSSRPKLTGVNRGSLAIASVTGGNQTVEVPAAKINLEFVLGNKVMVGTVNGNREYFEAAVRDLAMAEAQFPGWVAQLLTHPVQGLDNYQQLIETLTSGQNVIKRSARSLASTRPSVRPPRMGLHMLAERGEGLDLAEPPPCLDLHIGHVRGSDAVNPLKPGE
jgi:hypothetical protein